MHIPTMLVVCASGVITDFSLQPHTHHFLGIDAHTSCYLSVHLYPVTMCYMSWKFSCRYVGWLGGLRGRWVWAKSSLQGRLLYVHVHVTNELTSRRAFYLNTLACCMYTRVLHIPCLVLSLAPTHVSIWTAQGTDARDMSDCQCRWYLHVCWEIVPGHVVYIVSCMSFSSLCKADCCYMYIPNLSAKGKRYTGE